VATDGTIVGATFWAVVDAVVGTAVRTAGAAVEAWIWATVGRQLNYHFGQQFGAYSVPFPS
jgi:hypothetical protein